MTTSYTLIPIQPDASKGETYFYLAYLFNDRYMIELNYTYFGSTRIVIREKDDLFLFCNWCCGKDILDILLALNCAIGFLVNGKVQTMPFNSEPKPYMKDEVFFKAIMQEFNCYIRFPEFLKHLNKSVEDIVFSI